nr:histidine phosphatase family protein [uncultured Cohaesibacter sp.]
MTRSHQWSNGLMMRLLIGALFAVVSLLTPILPQPLAQTQAQAQEAVWSELQKGGVVVFRHALAPGTGDPASFTLDDCSTQRTLNETGRSDAKRIGDLFRKKNIRVQKVLTSQWCRCRETAELAFPGKPEDAPIFNSFFQDRESEPQQTRAAKRLIGDWSGPGTLVIITHQVNITALTGIFPSSGEGIVVRLEGDAIKVVGRVRL